MPGDKISQEIKKIAKPTSSGTCAKAVRLAVQRSRGEKEEPTGIESACDYGSWLEKRGYVSTKIRFADAQIGDIAILKSSPKHCHGHIQIYSDDYKWRSDFVQKEFYPYADGSKPDYVIFRPKNNTPNKIQPTSQQLYKFEKRTFPFGSSLDYLDHKIGLEIGINKFICSAKFKF